MLKKKLKTIGEFRKELKEAGWKKIGSGVFARVYCNKEHPGVVMKVAEEDKAYHLYAKWCMKNQDNPYVPKIFSHEKIELAYEDEWQFKLTITMMERLRPLRVAKGFKKLDAWEIKVGLGAGWSSGWDEAEALKKATDPHVRKLGKYFIRAEERNEFRIDLHDGNVMMRGDTPVYTDPLCS